MKIRSRQAPNPSWLEKSALRWVWEHGVCLVVDDRVDEADVASVLSQLLNRPVSYRPLGFDEDRAAMIAAGVPAPVAQMNAQAFSLIADGDAEWFSDDVPSLLGRPARSLQQFATDDRAAFS